MITMDTLIRRAADVTESSNRWAADAIDDDLDQYVTPDPDQGQRDSPAAPSISEEMNTRIRRAAGISMRPDHKSVPQIGDW